MVLVTGPTGSGKTVSLYTCLNMLNQPGVNISTVEDPAEINMPGVNQVNVNDKAGLNFAAALKSFLRQDPDVIMVGEIRDLETADIAIKAAQTGHMVLSTLHTNDAPTTLTRLQNMGVAAFNIASSILLITAQRLARRLCESCKVPADYPREALLKRRLHRARWTTRGARTAPSAAANATTATRPRRHLPGDAHHRERCSRSS
jgi:type IV pilus assembly protein PilB